jgi:hypothetical protein
MFLLLGGHIDRIGGNFSRGVDFQTSAAGAPVVRDARPDGVCTVAADESAVPVGDHRSEAVFCQAIRAADDQNGVGWHWRSHVA